MRRTAAALGSAIFFALTPGVVAGFVPWWLTAIALFLLGAAFVPAGVARSGELSAADQPRGVVVW